jgi:hypothetical protein
MTLPKMPRWTRPISKTAQKLFVRKVRDPQNVFVVIFDSIIFLISYAQAIYKGLSDSVEKPLFVAIDNLPNSFHGMLYALTQFGGLTALFFWAAAAWYVVNKRVLFLNLLSG